MTSWSSPPARGRSPTGSSAPGFRWTRRSRARRCEPVARSTWRRSSTGRASSSTVSAGSGSKPRAGSSCRSCSATARTESSSRSTARGGTRFTNEDQRLLEAFAASAATAVATATSAAAEQHRQRLMAAEDERRRWARELHDETLQNMAALQIVLSAARRSGQTGNARDGRRRRDRPAAAGDRDSPLADHRPASGGARRVRHARRGRGARRAGGPERARSRSRRRPGPRGGPPADAAHSRARGRRCTGPSRRR